MKSYRERNDCHCKVRWLLLSLAFMIVSLIGGFEAVTLIESNRYHKAISPFPELITVFACHCSVNIIDGN